MRFSSGVGYGIVGCGWVSASHAVGVRALGAEARLVAVADVDVARAHELAKRYDLPDVHGDYLELLARDDVDAVSICLPDHLHREAALAAADAGKHVLCEKPLALDLAEAAEMVEAFEARGLSLGLVMNHRFAPDNMRAHRAIRDGAIGRVLMASVVHSSALTGNEDGGSPWRGRRGLAAGGILATQAIHFLDLLLWFAGPASTVKAWTQSLVRTELDCEDTAALALQLESGALATLVTTNGTPIMDDLSGTRIEVHGSDGYLVLEGGVLRDHAVRPGYRLPDVHLPPPPQEAETLFGVGHIYEIAAFVRSLREGGEPPVPAVDGAHLMAVLAAAYTSAQNDREVLDIEFRNAYGAEFLDERRRTLDQEPALAEVANATRMTVEG
jgi:UDP-N-acetyl-2-amino-2-deoxyglucuronate dehydrogenase